MQKIKSLTEIDYTNGQTISFDATVISIDGEGDGEKKPFKATLKLEESGESLQVYSWNFSELPTYKSLVLSDDVYTFEAMPNLYKGTEKQIRTGNIRATGQKSNQKILKVSLL